MDPHHRSSVPENLLKKPNKSILKRPSIGALDTSSNVVPALRHTTSDKHQHYDEDNVKATYGPGLANKDYGHQKIEEAKTPFINEDGSERTNNSVDQNELLAKINNIEADPLHPSRQIDNKGFHLTSDASKSLGTYTGSTSKCIDPNRPEAEGGKCPNDAPIETTYEVIEDNDFSKHDSDRKLSSDEKAKKAKFDSARKNHYNMAAQMALARKLMEEEDDED